MNANVEFTKIHNDAIIPYYSGEESVGLDVHIIEDAIVYPSKSKKLRTGLVCKVPLGYYFDLVSRSSLSNPDKYEGIVIPIGFGVIDPGFNGPNDEFKIVVYNTSNKLIQFKKHDKVAQLILRPALKPQIIERKKDDPIFLSRKSRGGFGSTDKKNHNRKQLTNI